MAGDRRTRRVSDPATLKALTHPLRVRLYEILTVDGPATASMLATRVDETVGLVSYHLNQLGRHGFLVEAPELARDGRERWWRTVPGGIRWSTADFLDDPGDRAVAVAALRQMEARRFERVQEFHETSGAWGADWLDAAYSSDTPLRLTPDELREVSAELEAVVQRWFRRELPDDEQAREHVFLFTHAFPYRP